MCAQIGGGRGGRGEHGQERQVVIKLAKVFGAPITDDLDHARIYVARSWNLWPVHALLRTRGLPTYELLAAEFPSPDIPYFWQAMSALEGRPLHEWFDLTSGDEHTSLHRLAGDALGRVHAATRPHDGWVDQLHHEHPRSRPPRQRGAAGLAARPAAQARGARGGVRGVAGA